MGFFLYNQDDFFEEGIEVADYKGYDIRIYNKERMLIELIRYEQYLKVRNL